MISSSKWSVVLLIALIPVFGGAGCASLKSEAAAGRSVGSLRSFYVERLEGEESGLHQVIADELGMMGYTASAGEPGGAPRGVDALVTYYDKWFWDITPYLMQLDIRILDPETRSLIARGESYRPSLQRKKPREMVDETLTSIFGGGGR